MSTFRSPLLRASSLAIAIAAAVFAADPTVLQIGIEDPPATLVHLTYVEFGAQNNVNDAPPGQLTRDARDPLYNAAANPVADDDYYFAGTFPAGFNGLAATLTVPYREPDIAWERSHTIGDRTNRIHFNLTASQITAASRFRLTFEFSSGGSTIGGVVQPGFGDHDIVVRFKNSTGIATQIYSQRISAAGTVVVEFPMSSVTASTGANSIEIVRTGPVITGVSHYLVYDYVRLAVDANGNTAPVPTAVSTQSISELTPFTLNLATTDSDTPAAELNYELISGPVGLTVSKGCLLYTSPSPRD